MENIKRPFEISQRILQAHCQSPRSQHCNQSFVKELANPTLNRLITKKEEEHRTDNSGFAKKRVQCLIEHSSSHQLLWYVESLVLRNPLLRKAAKRCMKPLTNFTFSNDVLIMKLLK
jgi:hypothetical protein